jgi:hypothetical protein
MNGPWLTLALLAAPLTDQSLPPAPFGPALYVGTLANEDLSEVSGIAPSRRRVGVWFALNDGGNASRIYAFGASGEDLGFVEIDAVANNDWEDLSAFTLDGKPYLLIGDIGDNAGQRQRITLHALPEPRFAANGTLRPGIVNPAFSITLRFPDTPHDCEAIAIDPERREVLLLTKRQVPARLYSVPLKASNGVVVARLLGNVVLPQPTADDLRVLPEFNRFRSQPTSMTIDPADRRAVVLTYRNAYVFDRGERETWIQAFARRPQLLKIPPLAQAEAIAFSHDGRALKITSEKRPTPLIRFELK